MLKDAIDGIQCGMDEPISSKEWQQLAQCKSLKKALTGSTEIKDWEKLCKNIEKDFKEVATNDSGKPASYIPQLASASPDLFGISACSVDGQLFSIGDKNTTFTVQSIGNAVMYAMALEEHGRDKVFQHIGREPSGSRFNALVLDERRKKEGTGNSIPHNGLINTGGITSASLILGEDEMARAFGKLRHFWAKLSGDSSGCSDSSPSLMARVAKSTPPKLDLPSTNASEECKVSEILRKRSRAFDTLERSQLS